MPVSLLNDKDFIDNFEQNKEELKENCIYLMENLNFRPDEHGYVAPWVDPEDLKPKKEEPKEEEEEAKTGKDAKKKDAKPAADPKKDKKDPKLQA